MATVIDPEAYVCGDCGHTTGKWMGFCAQCRARGSLVASRRGGSSAPVEALGSVSIAGVDRLSSGFGELDRTLGGGFVAGAAIVLGGEPGVGKSTLVLQAAAAVVAGGGTPLVVSAEESAAQLALRASRLAGVYDEVAVMASSDVDEIIDAARRLSPALLVVDSIQTVASRDVEGMAGGVSQVRECGARLVAHAKATGTPVVLVGHVTKEGALAGPRVLEHVVDVVLYMDGDERSGLRFVRGLKNRFGSTPSLGLFTMGDDGLREVQDPAAALTAGGGAPVPGKVLFPAVEGRRPVMVEVQALVGASPSAMPRRSVKGLEPARLHQVLAVLGRHTPVDVGQRDVYAAVAGGVRIREPGADLAVALAVVSSHLEVPLPSTAAWGEVGLTGEIRAVSADTRRREEAGRMAVERIVCAGPGIRVLVDALAAAGLSPDARGRVRGGS